MTEQDRVAELVEDGELEDGLRDFAFDVESHEELGAVVPPPDRECITLFDERLDALRQCGVFDINIQRTNVARLKAEAVVDNRLPPFNVTISRDTLRPRGKPDDGAISFNNARRFPKQFHRTCGGDSSEGVGNYG